MKINDWKPEVRSLLKSLTDAGCKLVQSNNGEDVMSFADGTLAEFIDHLIACDESHLRVEMPDGERRTLFLVLGNSPGELVCDYGVHEVLDVVTDAHYTKWETRKQPTLEGEYGMKDGKYQFIVAEAKPLGAFEQWMVKSNLERLKTEGLETIVARLRASGYDRVADAVEKEGSAR